MARANVSYAEDTTAITAAYNDAIERYVNGPESVRVTDLVMAFNGSIPAMARAMGGIGPGKLPAKGTTARSQYDLDAKNIRRWLGAESKSGKKDTRKPGKESMERLKQLQVKKQAPTSCTISFSGDLAGSDRKGRDERPRNRDFTVTLPFKGATPGQFMDHMNAGDTYQAYQDIFQAYGIGRDVVIATDSNPDVSIDFSFEPE